VSGELAGSLRAGESLDVGSPTGRFRTQIDPARALSYVAFVAGSATAGAKSGKMGGKSGGHGAGGAVELDPVAVIAISKNGHAHLLTVDGDESSAWSALLQEVPDILGRLAQSVGDRVRTELNARGVKASEVGAAAEPAASALPDKRE